MWPHAGRNRRLDRSLVLPPAALTDIQRADEQHLLAALERRHQRLRVVEVAEAHLAPRALKLASAAGVRVTRISSDGGTF